MTYLTVVVQYLLSHPAAPVAVAIMLGFTLLNILRAAVTKQTVNAWIAAHKSQRFVGGILRISSGLGIDPASVVVGFIDLCGSLLSMAAKSREIPIPPAATATVTTTETKTETAVKVSIPREEPRTIPPRGLARVEALVIVCVLCLGACAWLKTIDPSVITVTTEACSVVDYLDAAATPICLSVEALEQVIRQLMGTPLGKSAELQFLRPDGSMLKLTVPAEQVATLTSRLSEQHRAAVARQGK